MKNRIREFWKENVKTIIALAICTVLTIVGLYLVKEVGNWNSAIVGMLMVGGGMTGMPIHITMTIDSEDDDD